MAANQPRRGSCGSAQFQRQVHDSIHSRFHIHAPGLNCQLGFDQVGEWMGVILFGGTTVPDLPMQLLNE
jgi:hypothetical protein